LNKSVYSQTNPTFRVFPIQGIGLRVEIDGSNTEYVDIFEVSYKASYQNENEYSSPILVQNTLSVVEYTFPIAEFVTTTLYDIKVRYNYGAASYFTVKKSSFKQMLPVTGDIFHGFNQVISPLNTPDVRYLHEGLDIKGDGMQIVAPRSHECSVGSLVRNMTREVCDFAI
jgi:hypothetical protein